MDLNELWIFSKVAQAGSFSAAARQLGMPKSTVSTKVSQLEKRLNVTLLQRTTRKLHLTDAGAGFLSKCVRALGDLQEAEQSVAESAAAPKGLLRVTTPVEMGTSLMGDVVTAFGRNFPEVNVELILTDRVVDLVGEGVDVAIRAGFLKDSSLRAKKLGESSFSLFAAPSYLKARGTPKTVDELEQHSCLRFTSVRNHSEWELTRSTAKGREKRRIAVSGRISANNLTLLKDLAVAGNGIAPLPLFLCGDDFKRGRLVPVLAGWSSGGSPISVVYPDQKHLAPKVRSFIEFLGESMTAVF